MGIEYRGTHDFSKEELEELFLSVEWSSGHFPENLSPQKAAILLRLALVCGVDKSRLQDIYMKY
ncbi:MAG: hypothetical protein K5668_04540 [Lachnospiraceae bacterium]|nr:hypothetical protein [Lachnospiraceae bacterium]